MASREYRDGVPPEGGITYQLTVGADGTHIENNTQWVQLPTEFGAANALQDMVLECDATVDGNKVIIHHPSGFPALGWFISPVAASPTQFFHFGVGSEQPFVLLVVGANGSPLENGAFAAGHIVLFARIGADKIQVINATNPALYMPKAGGAFQGDVTDANTDRSGYYLRGINVRTSGSVNVATSRLIMNRK